MKIKIALFCWIFGLTIILGTPPLCGQTTGIPTHVAYAPRTTTVIYAVEGDVTTSVLNAVAYDDSRTPARTIIGAAIKYFEGTTPVIAGSVLTAGTHTITATFAGTSTYAASSASATITVARAPVTVVYSPTVRTVTYPNALTMASLNAYALDRLKLRVAGSFSYAEYGKPVTAGMILTAGYHTVNVHFEPAADANGTVNYVVPNDVPVRITVLSGAVTVILGACPSAPYPYGTPLPATCPSATAKDANGNDLTQAGIWSFLELATGATVAPGAVLTGGIHTLQFAFTPADPSYRTPSKQRAVIRVTAVTPIVHFTPTTPVQYSLGIPDWYALGEVAVDNNPNGTGDLVPAGKWTFSPLPGIPVTILPGKPLILRAYWTPLDLKSYTRVIATPVTVSIQPYSPPAPVALFTYAPGTPEVSQAIQFTDGTNWSPSYWSWDFGDGSTSAEQNPIHAYTSAGSYTVTLTAGNSRGSTTVMHSLAVIPVMPTAGFTYSPATPEMLQSIHFSDATAGGPTSWAWSFGDGATSALQNPDHTYSATGTYTVTLTAGNARGTNRASQSVTVIPLQVAAGFTYSPAAPEVRASVQFSDASTGLPASWLWDFGDGSSSTLQNPAHTYATAGTYTITLTAGNSRGSSTVTQSAVVIDNLPAAIFSCSPTTPQINQTVQFADASTGLPTTWLWNFGDGTSSTVQNPGHVYSTAGAYTVTLMATNSRASGRTTQTVTVGPAGAETLGTFDGNIILGAPTETSIKASIFSPDQSGTVLIQYGTASGVYDRQTSTAALAAGTPLILTVDNLAANTEHYYRLYFWPSDGSSAGPAVEHSFHTARPAGSTFSFTIQADSHLDANSDLSIYQRTLNNVLSDAPDFHLDLGDTFMCEKYSVPFTATIKACADHATVETRYQFDRGNFATIAHSVPLFLVNGNHEGEAGWLADGTAQNVAIWTTQARQRYFLNPIPDDFYSGDFTDEPYVGKRAAWYAWQWGDALFVALDPFWNTMAKVGSNPWNMTLGSAQYDWLRETLAASSAKYKFIFIHDLVGGLQGDMRGGVEAASFYEWGGLNLDNSSGFGLQRPDWDLPIHDLLVKYGVTAVFHGHDHFYDKQTLDGIVYQEIPQPSAKNSSSGPNLAASYGYTSGTILSSSGHLRVTVSPDIVTVQYVRAWLPASETSTRKNGEIADSWTVSGATASFTVSNAAPVVNEAVQFTDTSTGSPTSWAWDFGDGATSSLQNPVHPYTTAGKFTVTLTATNASSTYSTSSTVAVSAAGTGTVFDGNVVLGSPTGTSIKANVFSPGQSGTVYVAFGTASGAYDRQSAASTLAAASPLELALDGLQANTQYFYRLYFQAVGESGYRAGEEATFHTARPAGSTFTFAIQGDSHPERVGKEYDATLYQRTLQTAAAGQPDFYLTIGDDFSVDTLNADTVTAAQVTGRYTLQRPFLGLIGRSAPLFLVNGNHEQAARYLLDGTPNNVAVWAQNARNSLYSQPVPGSFYTGNTEMVPYIGLLRNYYAWTWGDALFVVIDPYWESTVCVDNPFGGGAKRTNLWDITHGDAQYQWLKATLEQSTAKYKFVFAHHVMGTNRGGIELAGQYEWGGYSGNGVWAFNSYRPAWPTPIHQLMAANHVTIFFQGHDHIWVRQQLDGVTYQTLPEPADPFYALYNSASFVSGDKYPNTGYTRVMVSPAKVTVDYVRTYLPADEGAGKTSGAVAFSYSIP